MRKQSRAQIVGREGERWFASVLPAEWSIQRPPEDFGLDGIVAIGDSAHVTPYEFGVQIKSSSQFKTVRGHVVVPQISRDAVVYWSKKFFPTLLIAYDAKMKAGYFEWVSNLVNRDDLLSGKEYFYLHIPQSRIVSPDCWATIKAELIRYHDEFAMALSAANEILPVATEFATMLRNLCLSTTANRSQRDGQVLYTTTQAWTHIEVIRRLDQLMPTIAPGSVAERNLRNFRDFYFGECDKIFMNFSQLCKGDDEAGWIMMKKDSEVALNELTAMLADCVSGLLRHISPSK